jgi:hypothetical protein
MTDASGSKTRLHSAYRLKILPQGYGIFGAYFNATCRYTGDHIFTLIPLNGTQIGSSG